MNDARLRTWAIGLVVALSGVAALWVLGRLLGSVHDAVDAFALGAAIALVLEPVAGQLDRVLHARWASATVVLILVLGGLGVGFGYLGAAAFRQAQALAATLPALLNSIQQSLPGWLAQAQHMTGNADLSTLGQNLLTHFGAIGQGALTYSFAILQHATSMLTTVVVAGVIGFYILFDGRRMRAGLFALLPRSWHTAIEMSEHVVLRTFSGYVGGQLTVSALLGLLVGVSMWALGLPYPLLLGLQAGFFELLPTVGPILGGVAPVIIALSLPYPKVWYVLACFVAAQQVESNVLVPRICSRSVGLHPVAVILAIIAGFDVQGIIGALVAVPVTAAAYGLLRHFLVGDVVRVRPVERGRRSRPPAPVPPPRHVRR